MTVPLNISLDPPAHPDIWRLDGSAADQAIGCAGIQLVHLRTGVQLRLDAAIAGFGRSHDPELIGGWYAVCASKRASDAYERLAIVEVATGARIGLDDMTAALGFAIRATEFLRPTAPHYAERSGAPPAPLPSGMSGWIAVKDVQRALGCSRSTAHEYLRAAAGRAVGTGELLRVPVDEWERWARETLINGRRSRRWERGAQTRTPSTSTSGEASGGAGTTTTKERSFGAAPARRTRKRLAPDSSDGSVMPLIPTLPISKR